MRTRFATALSIAGVLGAGAVATAANTSILAGDTDSPAAPSAITLPAAQTAATAAPVALESSTSTAPATAPPSTPAPEAESSTPDVTTFNVGEAGALTVDSSGGHLTLLSAVTHDGWKPSEITVTPDGSSIAMNFVSATTQVWVRIGLVDGVPVPEIASNYVPGAVPQATETPTVVSSSGGSNSTGASGSGPSSAAVAPANPAPATPAAGYDDDDDDDEGEDEDEDEGEDDD